MKKRRTPRSNYDTRITPEAIAAWEAADYLALHVALSLHPGHPSPLPLAYHPLGVDPKRQCPWPEGKAGNVGWQDALGLQAEFLRLVGPPHP
jgi:hypothetical protein